MIPALLAALACSPAANTSNDTGPDPAPPRWTAVAAGGGFSCGLDFDGRVECWGAERGHVPPPEGEGFVQVIASGAAACAITAEGLVECWGDMPNLNSVPDGPVQDLMLGLDQCALVDGGALECFGGTAFERTMKDAQYTQIPDNSGFLVCGVLSGGGVLCEDSFYGVFSGSTEDFVDVDCLADQCCLLDALGDITCGVHHQERSLGGGFSDTWLVVDDGPWQAISATQTHFCAVGLDGALSCWVSSQVSQNDLDPVPEGYFVDVDVDNYHACALGADGQVTCWGRDNNGETSPPE